MRTTTRTALASMSDDLERIADAVEALKPGDIKAEHHYHASPAREEGWAELGFTEEGGRVFTAPLGESLEAERERARTEAPFERSVLERELGLAEVQHPLARVAVLAVSLNLKNRLDAKRTFDGSDVLEVIARYEDVQALRELLGPVTDDELEKATALYDTLAT